LELSFQTLLINVCINKIDQINLYQMYQFKQNHILHNLLLFSVVYAQWIITNISKSFKRD